MHFLFHWVVLVIMCKVKCQQMLNEELVIATQKPGENINIKQTNIERRFIEDLDDEEWHVAHLRGAVMDGRRDCMSDTFADKVRRYRKMLREDAGRVQFVSSKPLVVKPEDIVVETCKVKDNFDDPYANFTMKVTPSKFNVTVANSTAAGNTTKPTVAETTPKLDFMATIAPSKKEQKKKLKDNDDEGKNETRRGEYMFSSVEYYDESIEFDVALCPDAVEAIDLEIDELRSYDLECEMTVEWRSLE